LLVISNCSFFDFVPPGINIISPEDGEQCYGKVVLRAEVKDQCLDRTELYINGDKRLEYTKSDIFDEIILGEGTDCTIKLKAFDKRGNWKEEEVRVELLAFRPPNTPSAPSGPTSGYADSTYSFSAGTTDPDRDNVAYQFDWGDGNLSSWSSYVSSGSSVSMSHSWSSAGTYSVKVKAKDSDGAESDWSSGSTISFIATPEAGTVTDIDGNEYQTVKIGDQWWMAENLKVTHYRNGDEIDGCWAYNDNESNVGTYGRLYSWYSATDSRGIAPEGWHVPSDGEWQTLVNYLSGSSVAGGKMKETGTTHWNSPNTGATNESGFSALPGGYRDSYGVYSNMGNFAYFWSSTEDTDASLLAWFRFLRNDVSDVYRNSYFSYYVKGYGFSVRCVRD